MVVRSLQGQVDRLSEVRVASEAQYPPLSSTTPEIFVCPGINAESYDWMGTVLAYPRRVYNGLELHL